MVADNDVLDGTFNTHVHEWTCQVQQLDAMQHFSLSLCAQVVTKLCARTVNAYKQSEVF